MNLKIYMKDRASYAAVHRSCQYTMPCKALTVQSSASCPWLLPHLVLKGSGGVKMEVLDHYMQQPHEADRLYSGPCCSPYTGSMSFWFARNPVISSCEPSSKGKHTSTGRLSINPKRTYLGLTERTHFPHLKVLLTSDL